MESENPRASLELLYHISREIAATLDRHDAASERAGGPAEPADGRLEKLYQSLAILADKGASADRAEQLLNLFSDPVD